MCLGVCVFVIRYPLRLIDIPKCSSVVIYPANEQTQTPAPYTEQSVSQYSCVIRNLATFCTEFIIQWFNGYQLQASILTQD